MTIKHLVLSGGGPTLFQNIGSIQYLEENEYIKREEIETIYSVSAGSIVGLFLCLKFDWETINDYIIKRPWKEVFSIQVQTILNAYMKKGIYDEDTIIKCCKPLFDAKELSLNINLEDFYHFSKIEFHMFAFEINEFKMVDISYKTHPKMGLLDAIHASCAIPVLFNPIFSDNNCYVDGGFCCNYPLTYCLEHHSDREDEILGFKNDYSGNNNKNSITTDSTMLDFIINFMFKILYSLSIDHKQPHIKNEVILNTEMISISYLKKALYSQEIRKELLDKGIESAKKFLEQKSIVDE